MPKLCQVIALATGLKPQGQKALTEAHHKKLKPDLISGLVRSYRPLDDEGEKLPPEIKRVQSTVLGVIDEVRVTLGPVYDMVLTQDVANTHARADLVVRGKTVLKDVPVTYLLYLGKQAEALLTLIEELPTLDPGEVWLPDPDIGGYTSPPYETIRLAKVLKTHVAYAATPEHPAQTQTFSQDSQIGTWTNVKKSGAIPVAVKQRFLSRARALRDAIKAAREEANTIEVESRRAGDAILSYIFDDGVPAEVPGFDVG